MTLSVSFLKATWSGIKKLTAAIIKRPSQVLTASGAESFLATKAFRRRVEAGMRSLRLLKFVRLFVCGAARVKTQARPRLYGGLTLEDGLAA
jgi:hypothetical protein